MQSDLIEAIRSIRNEWNIDENVRQASEELRERELKRVHEEIDDAKKEAEELVQEARRQADVIVQDARTSAENLKKTREKELQQSREDLEAEVEQSRADLEQKREDLDEKIGQGHEQGHREGYEQGYEEGRAKFSQMVENLGEVLTSLHSQQQELYTAQVPGFQRFAIQYVEKIVGTLSEHVVDCVLNNVSKAAEELSRAVKIKVVVSEQDYDALMIMEDELKKPFPATASIELIKDAGMHPGGCLLESEIGSVDATIEGQMELLHQELMHE